MIGGSARVTDLAGAGDIGSSLRVVDDQVAHLLTFDEQVALEAVEEVLVQLLALTGLIFGGLGCGGAAMAGSGRLPRRRLWSVLPRLRERRALCETVYGCCRLTGGGKCTVRRPPSPLSTEPPVASASRSAALRASVGAAGVSRSGWACSGSAALVASVRAGCGVSTSCRCGRACGCGASAGAAAARPAIRLDAVAWRASARVAAGPGAFPTDIGASSERRERGRAPVVRLAGERRLGARPGVGRGAPSERRLSAWCPRRCRAVPARPCRSRRCGRARACRAALRARRAACSRRAGEGAPRGGAAGQRRPGGRPSRCRACGVVRGGLRASEGPAGDAPLSSERRRRDV